MEDILILILSFLIAVTLVKTWRLFIFPKIVEKTTVDVEKNPKWITPKLRTTYYGFSDIDIITAKSSIGTLPRFRLAPKKKEEERPRLELLISEDTSVNDIDKVAQLALRGKIHIFYGIATPNKSATWLSILLYMLDGGDINEESISWTRKVE